MGERTDQQAWNTNLVGHITDPKLVRLYEYWLARRGSRRAPSRSEIAFDELSDIARYLYLVEVRPNRRFLMRECGPAVEAGYGGTLRDKYMDEIDLDGVQLPILTEFQQVAASWHPIVSRWRYTKEDGRELWYEHLLLPLSGEGKSVDHLLCGADIKGMNPPRGLD